MMRSLRQTALLWMAGVITGVGLAGAAIAYRLTLAETNGFMDTQLHQIARSAGPQPRRLEGPTIPQDPEDDFVIQVWDADGRPLHPEGGMDIPRQATAGFADVTAGGVAWRVFNARYPGETVQVAQQMEVRREVAETAALQVAVPLLILVPVGCLAVGWAMSRALADLNHLARHVEALPADSRDPIDLADVPSEARPLVVAMNRLIERLRENLLQQRKFLSDAAHELRTPLTALNLQIGNLDRSADAAKPQTMEDLKQGARRAMTLVDQLLRMARYDAAPDESAATEIDLREVLLEAVADHVALAESRSIDLGLLPSQSAPVCGNARDLRILFGNLVDNAVKYTPEGGTVDVGLERCGEAIEATVSDTGPGLDAALLPRVFDRFFRAAPVDVEGSGLGLAVARSIAERHGFSIALENRTNRSGLRVRVTGAAIHREQDA